MTFCKPDDAACELCGDVARPARVLFIDLESTTATVLIDDLQVTIAIDLVPDVAAGDTVLVHQGFAIERVEV